LINDKLVNPKLLLDLPATPGPNHNGGVVLIGPDDSIYTVIGDLTQSKRTRAQNAHNGSAPDGTGGILRTTLDDKIPPSETILGDIQTLNMYYAYGIRNSFGMDFDPVTGKLWDTENGPEYGDEINLVEPGFNSGWSTVQGIWEPRGYAIGNPQINPNNTLVKFDGKGNYSQPELTWKKSIGVTALKFLDSDKYGEEYENDMFVGDFKSGRLYHFDLNKNRTELVLTGELQDKIADTDREVDKSNIVFAEGFGGITDLEVSPYDGYLYILSHTAGKVFRIVPA
jgi:glucose/arabinose dehydrogenase